MGEGSASRPGRSLPRKDPVPIVQEVGWAPGPAGTGAENLAPTGIRFPDRPARSQSLYRLSYQAHEYINIIANNNNSNNVSWHSSATLTEGFPCFFLSCKANARVKPAKTGHGPHSSKMYVLFYTLFVLCRFVYCLCVNVYCTTATGWLPNCS